MSNTSSITIINLNVIAQDEADRDAATGADPRDYTWSGSLQTIPLGMAHNPEGYAQQLRVALPAVNTLRMSFNDFSFNADGSLHKEYERFLTEAAKQGFKLILNYCDGEAQSLNKDGDMSLAEVREALNGSVHDRLIGGWTKMLDWLDRHQDVDRAVYGLEAINEPAGYAGAQRAAPSGEMIRLYGDHMVEFTELVQSRSDAKVLVNGWGYAQNFNILASTAASDGQGSVLDQIRAAAGGDLVWSAHLYPQWATASGQSIEGLAELMKRDYGILGDDDILLTETNAPDTEVNNVTAADQSFWMARAWEAFADAGIGLGWFPGAQVGASSFVSIDKGKTLKFYHPESYAQGMNGFLLGSEDSAHSGAEQITARLIAGKVMTPTGSTISGIDGIGLGIGHGGDDTITGIARAVNMLYGGTGNDMLQGQTGRDHLFGQQGDDTLSAGAGNDVLMGGDGADMLQAGTGADLLTGGRGADLFTFDDGGQDVITDFHAAEGDRLLLGGQVLTTAQIDAAARAVDYDKDGIVDDAMIRWSGGEVALLNYGVARPDGTIHGTDAADTIAVGYKDRQSDQYTWQGGTVDAGGGDDTINASVSADTLLGNTGSDRIDGRTGDDLIIGGEGHDLLFGGADDDEVQGGAGNDTISGADGNDSLYGGDGNDSITGLGGTDEMSGGAGDDVIDPGWGTGSTVDGGSGRDVIAVAMAAGTSFTLTGGADADAFEFRNSWYNGVARAVITDFDSGSDTIRFDGLIGFDAIAKNNKFGGFTDVGDDCVLRFGDDTYTFLDRHVSDLM